jgi:capsular exopolysaccharide synthesis family protein
MEDYPAPAPAFHLQKMLVFLRRLWWVPVITLTLAMIAAVVYLLWLPPTYISTSRLWETEKLRLPEGALFTEDSQTFIGTQTELLRSRSLREMVLTRLRASGTNAIPLEKDGQPLAVLIKVTPVPKSSVFAVEASSSVPAYTQNYLNVLMNEYLEYKKNARSLVSGVTLASISEQVLRLERDLKTDQDALTAFQRTNNLMILQEEGTIAGGYLAKLKTQLSDYQIESQLLEATALEHEKSGPGNTNSAGSLVDSLRGAGSISTSTAASESLNSYQGVELLKIQRERLSKNLRPKHPKIVKLDADIERGQRILEMYHNQSRDQLATARQALKMRTDSVLAAMKEWEIKVVAANVLIAEAERLKQSVNRAQSLYDRLVNLLQNVDISRNIDQSTLAILEPASPAERSYRQELQPLGLALFGGLFAGLGIIFLVAVRDDRFTSVIEVNEKFGDSIVGQVPDLPVVRRKLPSPLLEHNDDRHMYAESYRNLRSALLFLPVEGEHPKILLITSALPGEGKSTIAANLALTLAAGGSRVLLVDADLRQGHLHDLLGLRQEPGLVELLRQPADLDKIIQTNSLTNFAFISRGSNVSHPGDLLLGAALDQVLARWRERFDYVLIDTCPVFAADDATTLAPKLDGTLFVVRRRFSGARVVREAIELLNKRQARVLGLVFNRADASAGSYNYYKHAEYYRPAKTP